MDNRVASEVVQLYSRDEISITTCPVKELKDFKKIIEVCEHNNVLLKAKPFLHSTPIIINLYNIVATHIILQTVPAFLTNNPTSFSKSLITCN